MIARLPSAFWVVLGVLAVSAVTIGWAIKAADIYLHKLKIDPPRMLTAMATESEHWRRVGDDRIEPADVQDALGTENYVTRTIVRNRSSQTDPVIAINFHAAYYTGMVDTVPHVPDRCFIGGGYQQGARARVMPIELDLVTGMLRREDDDPFLADRTPDEFRPVDLADGSRTVYWIRLSDRYSKDGGRLVRVPFDPADLRIRVTEFIGPGDKPLYAGYFFIANGGVTPEANDVRLLAFNLKDKYAYYLKVQFTSSSVGSAEELVEVVTEILNEQLGEILLCTPDWIELQIKEADESATGDDSADKS